MNGKQKYWEELVEKANKTVDGLGLSLDSGIAETVVALWANGVTTSGSCEGHIEWGLPYSWVDIRGKKILAPSVPDTKDKKIRRDFWQSDTWKNYVKKETAENAPAAYKIWELLEGFYTNHVPLNNKVRLIPIFYSRLSSRIEPSYSDLASLFDEREKKEFLAQAQDEMQAFTMFLKKRYFNG